jgi:hypothetical protein
MRGATRKFFNKPSPDFDDIDMFRQGTNHARLMYKLLSILFVVRDLECHQSSNEAKKKKKSLDYQHFVL